MHPGVALAVEIDASLLGDPVLINEGIDWLKTIERREPIVEFKVVGQRNPLVKVGFRYVEVGLVQTEEVGVAKRIRFERTVVGVDVLNIFQDGCGVLD